jgi:protein phosphatase
VCVGHTHIVLDVRVGDVRVINPSSISNPFPPDLRAKYAVLEADARGYRIEQRCVDYDHAAVIDHVRRLRHPTADFIARHMLGQITPPWDRSA